MGLQSNRLLCVVSVMPNQSLHADNEFEDIQGIAAGFDAVSVLFRAQNHYRGWLFSRMLKHPSLFHAIVALCLAKMQILIPSADSRLPQELAYHRGRAIASVKEGLKDLDKAWNSALLETIVALANVEVGTHWI